MTISTEMITAVQALLEKRGIEMLTVPYEADAQIAHMVRSLEVDIALSDDSDCVGYACFPFVSKLDLRTGACSLLSHETLMPTKEPGTPLPQGFRSFPRGDVSLVDACAMCGSDY